MTLVDVLNLETNKPTEMSLPNVNIVNEKMNRKSKSVAFSHAIPFTRHGRRLFPPSFHIVKLLAMCRFLLKTNDGALFVFGVAH